MATTFSYLQKKYYAPLCRVPFLIKNELRLYLSVKARVGM